MLFSLYSSCLLAATVMWAFFFCRYSGCSFKLMMSAIAFMVLYIFVNFYHCLPIYAPLASVISFCNESSSAHQWLKIILEILIRAPFFTKLHSIRLQIKLETTKVCRNKVNGIGWPHPSINKLFRFPTWPCPTPSIDLTHVGDNLMFCLTGCSLYNSKTG